MQNLKNIAPHYPQPQTLPYPVGPQQMPHFVKQTQQQPSEPPPITLDYVEIVGDRGIKLPTEYSDAVATSLVGVIVVISLTVVTLALLIRKS